MFASAVDVRRGAAWRLWACLLPLLCAMRSSGLAHVNIMKSPSLPRKGVALGMKTISRPVKMAKSLMNRGDRYKAKRVALLVEPTPFTHVSGYANRFKEMLKFLREMNVEVAVATPDDKPDAPAECHGHSITTVDGFRFPLYDHLYLTLDLTKKARNMIEKFKPDLIHASSPGFFVLPAIAYARAMDIPLVLSYHTHLPVYAERYAGWLPFARQSSWAAIKLAHGQADLTLVTSPQMKDEFVEQSIKRVEVWRKGIDVDIFNPKYRNEATRQDVLLAPAAAKLAKRTILLYVGRISVEKRLDELAATLDDSDESVTLALVGGGPAEEQLKRHFARFGPRVHFCGVLRGDDLSKAYASADIFCMPSDSETLGFVVIEAMASGIAVVAANAGGIPDIVKHDSNGLLVEASQPAHFSAAVRKIIDDGNVADRLKMQGRKDAEGWGWRAATEELRDKWYGQAMRRHEALKKSESRLFPLTARALSIRVSTAFKSLKAALGLTALHKFVLDCFPSLKPVQPPPPIARNAMNATLAAATNFGNAVFSAGKK
ncbi:hypothetical protein M885DRAFT_520530 [Pelagophyceae sp. CCMP2097]|nr:hypothetical protein M885DRAFT_520530 [Pelagophyceae sp. CCMP2097]